MAKRFRLFKQRSPALFLLSLVAIVSACADDMLAPGVRPDEEPRTGRLALVSPAPQDVLPGTEIQFHGSGFVPAQRGKLALFFSGEVTLKGTSRTLDLELPTTYQSASQLLLSVTPELFTKLAGAEIPENESAAISGRLLLRLEQGRSTYERTAHASFTLRSQLTPSVSGLAQRAVYLGDKLIVRGKNFLLKGEGEMTVRLTGTFGRQIYANQPEADKVAQYSPYVGERSLIPLSRTEAILLIRGSLFGLSPGTYYGTLQVVSKHLKGTVKEAAVTQDVELALLRTQLAGINTKKLSRGQNVLASGAGFLPLDLVEDTATFIRLTGNFTTKIEGVPSVTRAVDLTILADVLDNQTVLFVPRPERDENNELVGLGATPGRFVGSVTPVVVMRTQQQIGFGMPCGSVCSIEVVPAKQVLYTKFLPNFTEGLRRFGLRAVEPEIREASLAVARRLYEPWYVEVRDSRPSDYAEFTTMEVGGPDPNGAGLFGLDNTEGKDTGNLRLDDYIGGFNATAEVEGSFAFGGVFIESFLVLSPTTKGKKNMLATPAFDAIFADFIPELGGKAAERAELTSGRRREALQEAIRVLGALVGNTIAHEFGHSLGLAIGESSHNRNDLDRELMDAGQYRSFEERAELGPYRDRPAGFSQEHRAYLDAILPRP